MTLADVRNVAENELKVVVWDSKNSTVVDEVYYPSFNSDIGDYKGYIVVGIGVYVYDYGEMLEVTIEKP